MTDTVLIVDDSADNISCMDAPTKNDLMSRIASLCSDLSAYGFVNEGNLSGGAITSAMDRILSTFYGTNTS